MRSVSIIICAFNEEKTIQEVVISCCENNKGSEIIVVDDGSTDNTESILVKLQKDYTFRYEKITQNKGKSWAMAYGIEKSINEIILFCDADLLNINRDHFDIILEPIFSNNADMVLGQPSETLIDYRINPFKSLSGQRALIKKDILPIINEIRHTRFGVETYINIYYRALGKRIKYVLLEGLLHLTKFQKISPVIATKEYILEGKEIAITLIQNQDLIIRRVENIINDNRESTNNKLLILQDEINAKIKQWIEKIKH